MTIHKFCYKKYFGQSFILFALIILPAQNLLHAQNSQYSTEFALKKSISTQKTGMVALGSWAVLNIFSGAIGYYNSTNDERYFHQMNAAWNLVNLGIAGIGYRGASNLDTNLSFDNALDKMQSFERTLLINSGLDVVYIGTGAWLWKRGINKSSSRQTGYGRSIVLQGSFLLLFDVTLYLVHNKHTQNLVQITDQLSFTGNGFYLNF